MDRYIAAKSGITVGTGVTISLVELATPSTIRATVVEWGVSFNGVTAADPPILCELIRSTGSMTGTSLTAEPADADAPASLVTAKHTSTSEGTSPTVLDSVSVHPQGGGIIVPSKVIIPVSGWVTVRVTAGTMTGVSAAARMVFDS